MSLILALCVVVRVKFRINGETAIVIRAVDGIAIIEVVQIHSCLSVCIEIETYHHILASLVNCRNVIRENVVTYHRIHIRHVVQLMLELQ